MYKNFQRKGVDVSGLSTTLLDTVVKMSNQFHTVGIAIPKNIMIDIVKDNLWLKPSSKVELSTDKRDIGTFVANLRSAAIGLKDGHKKVVKFTGTKAFVVVKDNILEMRIGLSHTVFKALPSGLNAEILPTKNKEILLQLSSFSKELVGQACSELVAMRKNPYEGGVHIQDLANPKFFKKRKQKNA